MITEDKKKRAVACWLLIGVGMLIVQIMLGGVTRLTGSGLSITEWKPIMGALPPMSEKEWQSAFEKYQQIAQYKYLNNHFTLSDFKHIFFWEWLHRLWARMLVPVFVVGFVYFLVKKYIRKDMVMPLVVLFCLGAAQGLIGWIMVASGLNDTNLYVDHIKLSIHFISALVLLCFTLWYALQLLIPAEERKYAPSLKKLTVWTIALLAVQLVYGAFMAGLKAAMVAPTWPTINGMWVPEQLWVQSFINHPINVHFMHRGLAYVLLVLVIYWFSQVSRQSGALLRKTRWWPLVLVGLQVLLGIITVLSAPQIVLGKFGLYETLAELHQLVAMSLLMTLLVNLFLLSSARQEK